MKRLRFGAGVAAVAATLALGMPASAAPYTASGTDPDETSITDNNWDIKTLGVSFDETAVTVNLEVYGSLAHIDSTDWMTQTSTGPAHGLLIALGSDLEKNIVVSRDKVEVVGEHGESCTNSNGVVVSYPDAASIQVEVPQTCLRHVGKVNADAYLFHTTDANQSDIAIMNDDDQNAESTSVNATMPGGYYMVASDGGVFALGNAVFHGSMGGKPLNKPMVGMDSIPNGYWTVASDGGIFSYGASAFHGSMGGKPLNKPMVGMAATPTGNGYWTVASDGGIFAYGDAGFHGSMGGKPLNKPIVGMASTSTGNGYWLVASDGGVFAFGDAEFHGSMGGKPLNKPIVGMSATPTDDGYRFVASDGGIFNYGDATYEGSGVTAPWADLTGRLGATATTSGATVAMVGHGVNGYYLFRQGGEAMNFGHSTPDFGDYFRAEYGMPNKPVVGAAAMKVS